MSSLLSDELLGDVMAAGHADVLVGLPTHNNARTVGAVMRAILAAFSGPFVRQRTVLLNLDGNSTDGTPEVMRAAATDSTDVLSRPYALRTIHRIAVPYHGVPGRSTALRLMLAVAELMRARAVVILDPTAASMGVEDVARWIRSVLVGGADYVKPALPRALGEGPLITQVVRPLFRAACGVRLLEPLDTQLACSDRFAVSALAADFWARPEAEVGLDAFLTAHALTGKFRVAQVVTAASAHVDADRRPGTAEVFLQVLRAVFAALAATYPTWSKISGSVPVDTEGTLPALPVQPTRFDLSAFTQAFRTGLDALAPLLATVLDAPALEALRAGAQSSPVAVSDGLWARAVLAFQAAAVRGTASAGELAQMLEPLYLGRVASFLNEIGADDGPDRLESLALAFEEQKQVFVAAVRGREEDDGTRNIGDVAVGS
jgi:hypothetical protein